MTTNLMIRSFRKPKSLSRRKSTSRIQSYLALSLTYYLMHCSHPATHAAVELPNQTSRAMATRVNLRASKLTSSLYSMRPPKPSLSTTQRSSCSSRTFSSACSQPKSKLFSANFNQRKFDYGDHFCSGYYDPRLLHSLLNALCPTESHNDTSESI